MSASCRVRECVLTDVGVREDIQSILIQLTALLHCPTISLANLGESSGILPRSMTEGGIHTNTHARATVVAPAAR